MQAISLQAFSSRSSTAGLANRSQRSSRQPARSVVVAAAKGNNVSEQEVQGPNKALMHVVGAIAAVQLALGGPAFAQDPLPDSAESAGARAEVNKETSNAPGLGDIGKNLTQNLFGGGDAGSQAKDAASSAAEKAKNAAPDLSALDLFPKSAESSSSRDAVNKETSDAPSLGDVGKSLFGGSSGSDVGQAGKEAADKAATKAKNAAPDLSQGIFDRAQKSIGKISQEAGSGPSQFPDALTSLGKGQSAAGKAAQQASRKTSAATSQVSSKAGDAASSAKDTGKKAVGKAKNAAPDLSQLPDPSSLLDKIQGKASGSVDEAKGQVQGGLNSAQGKVQGDIGAAQGKADEVAGKAQNAAPDLSQLPDPGALFDKIQGKVSGDVDATKGKVQGDINNTQGKVQSDIGATQGKVDEVAGKAKNAAPDLSTAQLPDGGQLLNRLQGRENTFDPLKRQAERAGAQVKKVGSDVAASGSKVGAKAKNAGSSVAGKAKNAAPDLSFNLLDIFSKEPKNAAADSKKSAQELQSVGGQNFSSGGGPNPTKQEGKDLKKNYKQGSKDLPVPDVGADVEVGQLNETNK